MLDPTRSMALGVLHDAPTHVLHFNGVIADSGLLVYATTTRWAMVKSSTLGDHGVAKVLLARFNP
jgi:hypothetical protein